MSEGGCPSFCKGVEAAFSGEVFARPDIWSMLAPCCVHMLHTVTGKVLDICKWVMSGVIALGLAQRQYGAYDEIIQCLVALLLACARPHIDEVPPGPWTPHRRRQLLLLKELLGGKSMQSQRRITLLFNLLPGDWSLPWADVYFSSADVRSTDGGLDALLGLWAADVAAAIYPNPTDVFARSRWMLAVSPLSETALLFNVHQLGSRSIGRWLDFKQQPSTGSTAAAAAGNGAQGLARKSGGWAVPVTVKEKNNVSSDASRAEPARPAGAGVDAAAPNRNMDWAEFNAKQRSDVRALIGANPASALVVMTTVATRVRDLFHLLVEMSGIKWDAKQEATSSKTGHRTYRVLEAVTGRWTADFYAAMTSLMLDSSTWQHLPESVCNSSSAAFAFALVAKAWNYLFLDFTCDLCFPCCSAARPCPPPSPTRAPAPSPL